MDETNHLTIKVGSENDHAGNPNRVEEKMPATIINNFKKVATTMDNMSNGRDKPFQSQKEKQLGALQAPQLTNT
jgi:hypothetical protein